MLTVAEIQESQWHDPGFVAEKTRLRNLRFSRKRRRALDGEEEYVSREREADFERERPALARQKRNKKPGDLSRAVPLAFDERGDFVAPLRDRIPEKQGRQARLLLELGLPGKARRQAWCRIVGRRRDCFSGDSTHRFFDPYLCGNRYCPICGPKSFRDLFTHHSRLRPLVDSLLNHRPGDHRQRVLAKLDITTRNVGEMPTAEEIRQFNRDIRRFFRAIETEFGISRREYGFLWCCEFGSGNTNLHAHGVYAGPFLPDRALVRLWRRIRADGSFVVKIKEARSFEAALGHALKYPSKFFDASPGRLAELEVAFDRVRRVHTLASFYNPKIEREPGEEGPAQAGHCPICGDVLLDAPGYQYILDFQREGRRETATVRFDVARAKALIGPAPT